MAQASARRSFHGPLLVTAGSPEPRPKSAPLELVPAPPGASSIGRAVIQAARTEEPTTSQRERVLAGVLAALRGLTCENR
jgi:hypothetical protein